MKIPVEELVKLDTETVFDYLSSKSKHIYNKDELKQIGYKLLNISFQSNNSKEQILNMILRRIGNIKVNTYLYPTESFINFIKLDKVKEFDSKSKLEFINKFGKYLSEYELRSLIYDEIEKHPPTYKEMLMDMYLNVLTNKTTV